MREARKGVLLDCAAHRHSIPPGLRKLRPRVQAGYPFTDNQHVAVVRRALTAGHEPFDDVGQSVGRRNGRIPGAPASGVSARRVSA